VSKKTTSPAFGGFFVTTSGLMSEKKPLQA
jgi:hypothetical protein